MQAVTNSFLRSGSSYEKQKSWLDDNLRLLLHTDVGLAKKLYSKEKDDGPCALSEDELIVLADSSELGEAMVGDRIKGASLTTFLALVAKAIKPVEDAANLTPALVKSTKVARVIYSIM